MVFYEPWLPQIFSHNTNPSLAFTFWCFWIGSINQASNFMKHLDRPSVSTSYLMVDSFPNLKQWKLWAIKLSTKHCFFSPSNDSFDPAEAKVKRLLLLDHLNTSEVIYILVLTRRCVVDFHSGLEKAAQFGDGCDGGKRKEAEEFERCLNHRIKKYEERWQATSFVHMLQISTSAHNLFYLLWAEQISIFFSVCCVLERVLSGTLWRSFEVSTAPALKLWRMKAEHPDMTRG